MYVKATVFDNVRTSAKLNLDPHMFHTYAVQLHYHGGLWVRRLVPFCLRPDLAETTSKDKEAHIQV